MADRHVQDRSSRVWLAVLVIAWGAQAIVTQSLLLREALVLMFGSEFAWGLVLFAWLLGVAAGAALGGWLAGSMLGRQYATGALIVVLLALSSAACADLWVFRGARGWLGVGPGELLPLPKTALAAMLFVSPVGALVGLAFPLACSIGRVDSGRAKKPGSMGRQPDLSFGHVYALESLGSLIGGAAFSFWAVERLTPLQTALTCAAITSAAAAGLLALTHSGHLLDDGNTSPQRRRPLNLPFAGLLALVALAAGLTTVFAGETLNRWLVDRRWRNIAPGCERIVETESKYQNLALGRRLDQFTLYCDGHVSGDFPDPYTFVPLAHFWMCAHPSPRNVLVLGGGAEGLLSEVLRHPIEHIDYVEPDPRQIELIRPYLAGVDQQALADPRVAVHHVDARYYVKTQRDRFDLVIARLPEPISALRARLYTDEFFGELRRAMTPRAVLCLTAAAAPTELSPASREYLASLRATLGRHFPHVVIGWGDPAQVLAATAGGLISTDPAELAARYTQRGVQSALFDPAWFSGATDWLDPDKLARRAADLDTAPVVQISTDLRPSLYVQRLVLWEAQTAGRSPARPGSALASAAPERGLLARLRSIGLGQLAAVLAAGGALTLVVCRLRRRARDGWAAGAVTLSVGTTGFATMALSIVWLFAFQSLYGYVYQRIGWIIALFMAGLVLGCLLGTRRANPAADPRGNGARRRSLRADSMEIGLIAMGRAPQSLTWQRLVLVDVLLALLALAVPFVLPRLAALQSSPSVFVLVEWCISVLVVLTGLLGGAAFALAGQLQLGFSRGTGAAAGSIVGADHAGACLGALLCGILLVPVFGTATAAFLLAGMKFCSGALLVVGWRLAAAR